MKVHFLLLFMCLVVVALWGCNYSQDAELLEAIRTRDLPKVQRLVGQGVNVNTERDGKCPLFLAFEMRDLEVMRFLLKNGANPDCCIDSLCNTPVMEAAMNGDVEVCRLMLMHGASINEGNGEGMTPLMFASMNGHMDAVKLLLKQGALPNEEDEFGNTALHYAVWQDSSLVEILIKAGCDVNLRNNKGATPLFEACDRPNGGDSQLKIVRVLLANGAKIDNKRIGQFNIFETAELNNNHEIAELLRALMDEKKPE